MSKKSWGTLAVIVLIVSFALLFHYSAKPELPDSELIESLNYHYPVDLTVRVYWDKAPTYEESINSIPFTWNTNITNLEEYKKCDSLDFYKIDKCLCDYTEVVVRYANKTQSRPLSCHHVVVITFLEEKRCDIRVRCFKDEALITDKINVTQAIDWDCDRKEAYCYQLI